MFGPFTNGRSGSEIEKLATYMPSAPYPNRPAPSPNRGQPHPVDGYSYISAKQKNQSINIRPAQPASEPRASARAPPHPAPAPRCNRPGARLAPPGRGAAAGGAGRGGAGRGGRGRAERGPARGALAVALAFALALVIIKCVLLGQVITYPLNVYGLLIILQDIGN